MTSRSLDHLNRLTPSQRSEVEDRIEAFERAWQSGERPAIADHLSADAAIRVPLLVELVQIDREWRIKRGDRGPVESYQQEFPEAANWLHPDSGSEGDVHSQGRPRGEEAESIRERPGSTIGFYHLLEQIGEGGFGQVFVAEQQQPVRRKVALKVIKPGMDTRDLVARFEAERQALALMDHPNIARVIDGGTTDSGRPYFVMELVRGIPITDYCDQNRLTTRQRLELFVTVCQAVQHAHQKGIVHRDIKPSNVLVAEQDGRPIVKVIDFGVAKALYQPLTDKTIHTHFAQLIGTPLYMSPEQAEMGGLDIDTRSDIYSLGVLLYELLTGTTPFDRKRFVRAAYDEFLRIIRNEEPPRPSTRLSFLGDTATTVAGHRGVDAKRLSQLLSGDLDWVVMKAIEKDRNRRYETPNSFAEDIERYLHDEAILARPPSKAYRFRKFTRRNRASLLTAMVIVAALLTGTAVSVWQALRALGAARVAKAAQDDALAREAETKAVLGFVESRILKAARPENQVQGLGREVTLRKAIESALPYVGQSFAGQPLIEARLRLTLGQSFYDLGDFKMAAEQAEAARTLFTRYRGPDDPDTLESMNNLANAYDDLGRQSESLKLHEETLALRKASLGADHPDTFTSMSNVANSYRSFGRMSDALELNEKTFALRKAKLGPNHRDTLESAHSVAISYDDVGRLSDALKLREETLALEKAAFGIGHPETLRSMSNLAISYDAVGRHGDAIKLQEQTLALMKDNLGPSHRNTLNSMINLANSYYNVGRIADALKLNEQTLAILRATLGSDHPDTLTSMNNLAVCYFSLGRNNDALKLGQETLAIKKTKLGLDHPETLGSMDNVANFYHALGRYNEALKLHEETVALLKAKLGSDHPQTLATMNGMADDLLAVHRGAEAVVVIDDCVRRAAGKTVDPRLLTSLIDMRVRYFEAAKDAAGCRQTADMWEQLKQTDVDSLYMSAGLRAITTAVHRATDKSQSPGRQADVEADLAMAWLKKAVAAGYKDVAHIKTDKDLASLRGRVDFKKLLLDMEPGKSKSP